MRCEYRVSSRHSIGRPVSGCMHLIFIMDSTSVINVKSEKIKKTSTDRVRAHRARKKLRRPPKKVTKTNAERCKEFRAKQKLLKKRLENLENGTDEVEIKQCNESITDEEDNQSRETTASMSCQTDPWLDEPLNEPTILFCWQNGVDASTQTKISRACSKVEPSSGTEAPTFKMNRSCETDAPSNRVRWCCNADVKMNYGFSGYSTIQTEGSMSQLTGISFKFFSALLTFVVLSKEGQAMYYKKVQSENRLLLFLMKLKLGISYRALGSFFGVSSRTASDIFFEILQTLTEKTKNWIVWPSKKTIQQTMPSTFSNYKNCRCIIDCTEIRTESPPTIEQRALMYSYYKGFYTIKFLIGLTPDGSVCKVSKGYGGRATDNYITKDSGFLDLIEPGDLVLADKGFPQIRSELLKRNGVAHGDDTFYVLGSPFGNSPNTPNDRAMQRFLLDLWASYATTGIPQVGIQWPVLDASHQGLEYLHIKGPGKCAIEHHDNFGQTKFWDAIKFNENILAGKRAVKMQQEHLADFNVNLYLEKLSLSCVASV